MYLPNTYPIEISDDNFEFIKNETWRIIENDQDYPRKIRSKNFYKKLSPKLLEKVDGILSSYPERGDLTWYFEIFYSMDPVGMHNDRNFFIERNELCERGLIIPLEWTGTNPKTRFYNLFIDEKVNWDGSGFKNLSGVKKHFSQDSLLNSSDLCWKKKTILFFDSQQIHDASIFQESTTDYKLSINALGYSRPTA